MVAEASLLACWAPVRTWVAGGRIGRSCATSCFGDTPALALTRMSSSLPTLSNSRCAVASWNPASVAPPSELAEPNQPSPEICILTYRSVRLDSNDLAGSQIFLGRRVGVHDHLRRSRPVAADQAQRVELRLGRIDAEAQVGGAAERDGLAVVDQLGGAGHAADGVMNARQAHALRGPGRSAGRTAPTLRRRCSRSRRSRSGR